MGTAGRDPEGHAPGDLIVRAESLTKYYGRHPGVVDLSFTVRAGEVFGYLGPNGAGKTTTIRLMLDLIRPSSGTIELFGLSTARDSVGIRRRIGYLPGDLRLYERLTGWELVRYFASLSNLPDLAEAERLAQRLELDLDRPYRTLSRGNRQKVGLVQAFMHRPELLVLDEPTAGLDPLMQHEFYELVRETIADGRTVFLSSHALAEVQRVADRVALVRDGRVELVESVEQMRARALTRVEATLAAPPPRNAFADVPGTRELDRHGSTILFALEGPADPLVKALAQFEVIALDSHEPDLDDVFLALFRGEERRAA